MNVSQTILQQLGGKRFIVMTGAKNFATGGDDLRFHLPRNFCPSGVNYVKISLNSMDLYDIEFGRIYGTKYTVKETRENVYNDMLQSVFTSVTGLDTSLGRMAS